jgi:hypothetical protein
MEKRASGASASVALVVLALGCADAPESGTASIDQAATPTTVVDSILPIAEEIRRFREVLGPDPGRLTGGANSLDALVDRFAVALAQRDTAALLEMLLTRDEFGWLYYPHTRYTTPPYELPPSFVWFQIENGSSQGLGRLLERLAGPGFEVLGHSCPPEPLSEGPNRIWDGCSVRFDPPEGDPRDLALFGGILERDEVFKFISYSNGF